ncbi:hypothetical protein M569_17660, partial [Genlisea aurea]
MAAPFSFGDPVSYRRSDGSTVDAVVVGPNPGPPRAVWDIFPPYPRFLPGPSGGRACHCLHPSFDSFWKECSGLTVPANVARGRSTYACGTSATAKC